MSSIREGYLTKQGGFFKTWHKRWFILKKDSLVYYQKKDGEKTGDIPLFEGATQVLLLDKDDPSLNRENSFKIYRGPEKRTYYLEAEDSIERDNWMNSIDQVLKNIANPPKKLKSQKISRVISPAPPAPILNLGLYDLEDMYSGATPKPLPKLSNHIIDVEDDNFVPSTEVPTQNIPAAPPPPYTPKQINNNNNKTTKNSIVDDNDDEVEFTAMKILPPSNRPVSTIINVIDDDGPEEIAREWEDVDLVDPVTFERMTDPVRGDNCKHKAVFDRKIYGELKQQNPQAGCPICKAKINKLLPNALFKDILQKVTADKIRIYPNNSYEPVN